MNIIEKISKKILCVNKESQEMINLINSLEGNNLELIEKEKDSEVEIFSKETIDEAIKNCLYIILSLIEKYSNLDGFTSFLKEKEKCFDFLNKFYEILKQYNYEKFMSSRIIPNCKGEFKNIKELYGNKIEEDELYSIYKKLGKTFDDSIIHKEINLDDLSKCYTDKDVAKGIEDYYIKIFVFDKIDINRVNEDIKAISIGLFDWMEKNEEKAQNLMEFFKNKINRARLLDLTVVNTLHEKSKFYDQFKKFFKNEEEFKNLIKNGLKDDVITKIIELLKNQSEPKIIRNDNVSINLDDVPNNVINNFGYEDLLYRIGSAGEKAAYEYLIEKYINKGFIPDDKEKNSNRAKLTKKNCNDFVEIKFSYSRSIGYDIEILINENKKIITKYVEVKTHTQNSIVSGKIKLTYRQYCLSRGNENYSIIVMKAFFVNDEIKCILNKYYDPFYLYEGKEVRPEYREYNFEFDE